MQVPGILIAVRRNSTARKYGGTSRPCAATRNNSRLGISGEFGQREPPVPRFAGVLSAVQRTLDVVQQRVHTRQPGGLATAVAAHRDHARPVAAPGRAPRVRTPTTPRTLPPTIDGELRFRILRHIVRPLRQTGSRESRESLYWPPLLDTLHSQRLRIDRNSTAWPGLSSSTCEALASGLAG